MTVTSIITNGEKISKWKPVVDYCDGCGKHSVCAEIETYKMLQHLCSSCLSKGQRIIRGLLK